jgi:hypothetical protein
LLVEAQKDGPSEIFPGEVEDVISGADEWGEVASAVRAQIGGIAEAM